MQRILEEILEWHHGNRSGFSRHYLTVYSMVIGLEAKKVLELGSGFSSKVILEALKKTGGKLITLDQRSVEETGNSQELMKENPNWTYMQGDSTTSLKTIKNELGSEGFDLVLHDGSHEWKVVLSDLRKIIPMMKKNGIILVHDTFHKRTNFHLMWSVRLAFLFVRHERVTLPYGYGLTIIRTKGGKGEVTTNWEKGK